MVLPSQTSEESLQVAVLRRGRFVARASVITRRISKWRCPCVSRICSIMSFIPQGSCKLTEGTSVPASGHHSFLMSRSFTNLVSVKLDLFRYWQETTAYKYDVYLLPKQLHEKVTSRTLLTRYRAHRLYSGTNRLCRSLSTVVTTVTEL